MAASTSVGPGRVFISYRRDDSAFPAGWLYDRLCMHLGREQVFKDVDSIDPGDDFFRVIENAVGSCQVLLALIGDRWLDITDETGQRRLDDPDDFVRLEIEAALRRDVRVIPILVGRAPMPRSGQLPDSLRGLVRRNAIEVSPNRFESDLARLVRAIDKTLGAIGPADAPADASGAPQGSKPTVEKVLDQHVGLETDIGQRSAAITTGGELATELGIPALDPLVAEGSKAATKRCPDCAETVLPDAKVCKQCGYRFAPVAESKPTLPERHVATPETPAPRAIRAPKGVAPHPPAPHKTTEAKPRKNSPTRPTELRPGDRVQVVAPGDRSHSKVGTVIRVLDNDEVEVKLGFLSGTYTFGAEELQFLDRPIRW